MKEVYVDPDTILRCTKSPKLDLPVSLNTCTLIIRSKMMWFRCISARPFTFLQPLVSLLHTCTVHVHAPHILSSAVNKEIACDSWFKDPETTAFERLCTSAERLQTLTLLPSSPSATSHFSAAPVLTQDPHKPWICVHVCSVREQLFAAIIFLAVCHTCWRRRGGDLSVARGCGHVLDLFWYPRHAGRMRRNSPAINVSPCNLQRAPASAGPLPVSAASNPLERGTTEDKTMETDPWGESGKLQRPCFDLDLDEIAIMSANYIISSIFFFFLRCEAIQLLTWSGKDLHNMTVSCPQPSPD